MEEGTLIFLFLFLKAGDNTPICGLTGVWLSWASSCNVKGHQFDSWSGHMSGLQVLIYVALAQTHLSCYIFTIYYSLSNLVYKLWALPSSGFDFSCEGSHVREKINK